MEALNINKNENAFSYDHRRYDGVWKTHYLLEMLEKEYKNHFDYIFIVCPTLEDNKTYQNWEYLKDFDVFELPCDHNEVEEIIRQTVEFAKNTNSLIILDDCAASKDVKNRTSELVKLAFSGRHIGLSTIVITQQLTSIAKPYRMNISKLVTFYNSCRDDMKYIFNNYLNVEKNEKKILETLKNNDYARLEILTVRPYAHEVITVKSFKKNFF